MRREDSGRESVLEPDSGARSRTRLVLPAGRQSGVAGRRWSGAARTGPTMLRSLGSGAAPTGEFPSKG